MARTIALILSFLFLGSSLFAQQALLLDRRSAFVNAVSGGGGCTVTTNPIVVTLLTNLSSTANAGTYETPTFTPLAAGDAIVVFAAYSPVVATANITNTGTTQLSWPFAGIWQTNRYARTNFNTGATPTMTLSAWISQLPPGVAPFAMTIKLTTTSGTGVEMIVLNVSGADTNLLWGQSAIHQVASVSSNAVAHPRIDWAAPGNSGSNTIIYALADGINDATNRTQQTGWTVLSTNAHNTPAMWLGTYYKTYVPAATTFTTNTASATSRNWAGLALELRAGTNACGYEDPLTIPTIASGARYFYVDTASETAGGTGTVSNQVSGTDRAFKSLSNALVHANLKTNAHRVIWCKGATNDISVCLQGVWDEITNTTPTAKLYIVGDNITGTNNPNTYKIAATNNNVIYNNAQIGNNWSGASHVYFYNLVIMLRGTTSSGATYTCFRGATANVGINRTDCDIRFINCGADMSTSSGATDDVSGFYDSDFATNDARNRCKRINCWASGGTVGFGAADAGPFQVENYFCTGVSNYNHFIDVQLIVNCGGFYTNSTPGIGLDGQSFNSTGSGQGFSGWNSSNDTTIPSSNKHSRGSQTPTFLGPYMYLITSGDTSMRNVGISDPLNGAGRFDILGVARPTSAIFGTTSMGVNHP